MNVFSCSDFRTYLLIPSRVSVREPWAVLSLTSIPRVPSPRSILAITLPAASSVLSRRAEAALRFLMLSFRFSRLSAHDAAHPLAHLLELAHQRRRLALQRVGKSPEVGDRRADVLLVRRGDVGEVRGEPVDVRHDPLEALFVPRHDGPQGRGGGPDIAKDVPERLLPLLRPEGGGERIGELLDVVPDRRQFPHHLVEIRRGSGCWRPAPPPASCAARPCRGGSRRISRRGGPASGW